MATHNHCVPYWKTTFKTPCLSGVPAIQRSHPLGRKNHFVSLQPLCEQIKTLRIPLQHLRKPTQPQCAETLQQHKYSTIRWITSVWTSCLHKEILHTKRKCCRRTNVCNVIHLNIRVLIYSWIYGHLKITLLSMIKWLVRTKGEVFNRKTPSH